MNDRRRMVVSIVLALVACFVSACGGPPAQTPEAIDSPAATSTQPPTATIAPAATDTPLPPTATAPPPTETAPPPTETAPTPTDTPQPPPTDTPVPPTPASSEPTATATPVLEPVRLRFMGAEGRRETVGVHRPVIVEWGWAVCDLGVLQDNLEALTFELKLDGAVIASGPMEANRGGVREEDRPSGIHTWAVDWSHQVGPFQAGSSHRLELIWNLSRTVSDGCDVDGDGQPDAYGPGVVTSRSFELVTQ